MASVHRFDTLPSTMEVAHALAKDGAEHGTVVVASEQTGARGTRGKAWSSPVGGLWFSVIVRPTDHEALAVLSIRTGLALADALQAWSPALPPVMLKWPNDLQIAGKKCAGILCEARWSGERCQWVVIGAGINDRNDIAVELQPIATRLSDHLPAGSAPCSAEYLAERIVAGTGATGLLSQTELQRWTARDALHGRRVEAPLTGIGCGIAPNGALQVLGEDGRMQEALSP